MLISRDACLAQAADVVEGHGAGMQASHGAGFLIDEGLHAERDAIDACAEQRGQDFLGERAGRDFDRDLGVRAKPQIPELTAAKSLSS